MPVKSATGRTVRPDGPGAKDAAAPKYGVPPACAQLIPSQAAQKACDPALLGDLPGLRALWCIRAVVQMQSLTPLGLLMFFAYLQEWASKLSYFFTGRTQWTTPKVCPHACRMLIEARATRRC